MPIVETIRRFSRYWGENFSTARERYDMIWPIVSIVLVAGSPLLGSISQPLENIARWAGIIIFSSWGVLWLPFRRHESLTKEQIELQVELPNPNCVDPTSHHWAFRVRVTNKNPTKDAKAVRVWLHSISCAEWEAKGKPPELEKMSFPHLLPQKGFYGSERDGHDIYPKPFEMIYDLFFIGGNLSAKTILIAPYCFNDKKKKYVSLTPNVEEFEAVKFGELDGKLSVTVLVTCDGMKPITKNDELIIPAYSNGTLLGKKEIEPPHWLTANKSTPS